MYGITVKDISVFAYHGVLPEEKRDGQEFLIDLEMDVSTDSAVANDDISMAVDYSAVTADVAGIATGERFDLIETLASTILDHVLSVDGVLRARITVKKPLAPLPVKAGWVGVTVSGEAAPGGEGKR